MFLSSAFLVWVCMDYIGMGMEILRGKFVTTGGENVNIGEGRREKKREGE